MSEKENLETELSILTETLEEKTKEFNSSFKTTTKALAEELEKMRKYNVMLQSVPTKLNKQLEEKTPRIVEELHKSVINEMNAVKEKYNEEMLMHQNFLKGAESEIQSNLDKFTRFEKSKVKRFFLGIIISSIIATSAAIFAASYYVKGKFLQNVSVTHPDKIYL